MLTVERGSQGRQVYALCTLSVLRSSERSSKERILRKQSAGAPADPRAGAPRKRALEQKR